MIDAEVHTPIQRSSASGGGDVVPTMAAAFIGYSDRYPARNRVETRLLRAYRHAVSDFARELLVANDKVNPALLNALSERADQAWSAFQLRRCIERLEDRTMFERFITPKISSLVVVMLHKRKWSNSRVARQIKAEVDFVERVEAGIQSFELADVKKLAREFKLPPHRFLMCAIAQSDLPPDLRGLIDSGAEAFGPLVLPAARPSRSRKVHRVA